MCGSIFGSGRRWSALGRRRWPTRGCRNGSCKTWSVPMAEIIVALDLPSATEALRLLERLGEARWVKVGSVLMTREGPPLLRALVGRGFQVFLDLKWHDIPNTVADAVAAA